MTHLYTLEYLDLSRCLANGDIQPPEIPRTFLEPRTFRMRSELGLLDRIAGKFYDRYLMQEVKLYFLLGLQRSFFFGMFVCCMTWMKNFERKPDLTRFDP